MRKAGVIVRLSRNCLRRQPRIVSFVCPFNNNSHGLRHSYSNSYSSIPQVEQSTIVKSPHEQLDEQDEEEIEEHDESEEETENEDDDELDELQEEESNEDCFSDDLPFNTCWTSWWRMPYGHGLVSNLIQVFSVSLHTPDFDDDTPSQIHGYIHTTDSQGVISNLYTRTSADPQIIPHTGVTLSLIGGHDENVVAFAPSTTTIIDLNLCDTSRNALVLKNNHYLHSTADEIEDSCNKLLKDIIHGGRGFALIYYTKFLLAVSVLVKVAILSKRDPTSPVLDVYGDIVAGYGNAREYCDNDDDVRHIKSTLFSKPFNRLSLGGLSSYLDS